MIFGGLHGIRSTISCQWNSENETPQNNAHDAYLGTVCAAL